MADEKTRLQEHVEESKRKKAHLALLEERRKRAAERFRSAVNEQLKTRAGMDMLVGLFHLCGYNLTSVVSDPESGEVLDRATSYNDARRSVYVDLRKLMEPEARAKMELLAETGGEEEKKEN